MAYVFPDQVEEKNMELLNVEKKKCKDAAYSVLYLCLWDEVKKRSEYCPIVIIQ